jgi:tRNA threonylcarbamoyladenosine biosynthesis protein TsaE
MDLDMIYTTTSLKPEDTQQLGYQIGQLCRGGETIELVSDLGGGKTVFVQGLAKGLGYEGDVSSPTFVISRDYVLPKGLSLHHFDLYRIIDGDIAALELAEFIADPHAITAVEWGSNVSGVLPKDRIVVTIVATGEDTREITVSATDAYNYVIQGIKQ